MSSFFVAVISTLTFCCGVSDLRELSIGRFRVNKRTSKLMPKTLLSTPTELAKPAVSPSTSVEAISTNSIAPHAAAPIPKSILPAKSHFTIPVSVHRRTAAISSGDWDAGSTIPSVRQLALALPPTSPTDTPHSSDSGNLAIVSSSSASAAARTPSAHSLALSACVVFRLPARMAPTYH